MLKEILQWVVVFNKLKLKIQISFFCSASKKRPMFGPAGGRFDRRRLDEMNMTIDVHVDRNRHESGDSGMETD